MASAERLDFRLCGGLRVNRGDDDLDLTKTARQGRLALAYLVLHRDRAVTRDELMERIWPEPDPQRVAASLSQTLSRLRRVLGRETLERLPSGAVRLRGPVSVDVEHARDAVREGGAALADGAFTLAWDAAQAALAEIAGEVLAGDEADWLEPVRRDVAELRLDALELAATAALRIGAPADAEAAAREAVGLAGMRESAWRLLIEAQAAHGDIARATETLHEFRTLLRDRYGLTPSRELIELHGRLVGGEAITPATRSVAFPPALSLESGEEAFIGRDDVLARLRERYACAQEGTRQFVLLCGESGIGKTRLASEFAREAHGRGAIVLYGRSDAETLVPYQPFVAAIEHYLAGCGAGDLARELDAELSELGRLLPGLRRQIPTLREPLAVEPEMRRFRLFNAVVNVLAYVARDDPVVLVLDDLQWADTSTALLLRHTVQEIQGVKLLVLGTLRDVEPCLADPLADLLARPQRGFERLSLQGLDASETAAFVMARQGRSTADDALGVLQEATGGNPLLLEETLKSLAESEPSAEGVSVQAVRRVGVPEGAKYVIGRRLERLTAGTQRVLADASVLGAEFDVRVLEAVAEPAAERVIPALEEAETAGLVREVPDAFDRFSFSHALVRDALREGQSTARRRRLHRRIGEALEAIAESSPVHPAELAHHFLESREPGDSTEKALRYSIEAGDRAAESLAYEDAANHYRCGLSLLERSPDGRERCALLLKLGGVELRQGAPGARATFEQAAELARRHELPRQLGQAALGFASRYTEVGVVDEEGIALLRAALRGLDDEPSALRAELTARLAESLHFAPEQGESAALSQQALVMAREAGDTHALVAALESRHAALLHVEHLDERLRLSQELIDLAERVEERELKALGHHWRIYDLLEAADVEGARRERHALDELARQLRQPLYEHFAAGWEVVWAHMAGEVDRVEGLAQRFYELGLQAQARDTETIYRAQLIALRRREERLSDFVSIVQAAVAAHPALLAWRAVLPLAHLASGNFQAAVAEIEWLAHDGFSRVHRDMFWFTTICVLAETCALIRDNERAPVLYEMLLPYQHRNVQVTQAACWGSCERFLGLLAAAMGRWDVASGHFESAIAKNESGGLPGAASLVRRDYAEMLVARGAEGDRDRAVSLLQEPLEAAERAGMEQLSARIRARLEQIRQS